MSFLNLTKIFCVIKLIIDIYRFFAKIWLYYHAFRIKRGKIMIYDLDIFRGISAFAYLDNDDRVELDVRRVSEEKISFGNDRLNIDFTVSLNTHKSGKTLAFSAEYRPQNTGIYGANHFGVQKAVGINVTSIDSLKKYMATYRYCEFWTQPSFGENLCELKENTQAIIGTDNDGKYFFLTALCDDTFKTTVCGNENGGMDIYVWSNDFRNSVDTTAVYYSFGEEPFGLAKDSIKEAMLLLNSSAKMREDRIYPEVFEYLGWCSWDAFQMYVTHDDLIKKAQEFRDKEIPVKWMLLDDMWGDVPNNDIKNMHSRELYSFEAAPERFPKGLKGVLCELKSLGMRVGLWHPTTGYWHGINPASKLALEFRDLLFYSQNGGRLIHSFDEDKIEKYYDIQHNFYKNCGVDFIKVDNQSCIRMYAKLVKPIGTAAKNLHTAIEKVAFKYYDGALINCMGMAIENFWHRQDSAVCRFSGDFQPENRDWFTKHIIQCSYNSVVQGTVYVGDWDMWWSDDNQAKLNALIHSMSGGPIYISDKLNRSVKETIMPTVYSDGKIIRLDTPAKPTLDCLFSNPKTGQNAYKLFNRHRDSGVLAVFNLTESQSTVSATISVNDMLLDQNREYTVYDWKNMSSTELPESGCFHISVSGLDDYRLYIFAPIENDIAVIGLYEKYMSVATYIFSEGKLKVFDDGEVMIYCRGKHTVNNKPVECFKENLYKFKCIKNVEYLLNCER